MKRHYYFEKPCSSWNNQDVCKFIAFFRFPKAIVGNFQSKRVVGHQLLHITNSILRDDLKISKLCLRLNLLAIIRKMKKYGKLNPNSRLVKAIQKWNETGCPMVCFYPTYSLFKEDRRLEISKEKVQAYLERLNFSGNLDGFEKISRALCVPEEMYNFYFKNDFEKILNDRKVKGFPVKLVITELNQNTKQRYFRQLISKFVIPSSSLPEFGLFHAAIIVGPWYLEWNNTSLIIPKTCFCDTALFCGDLGKINKNHLKRTVSAICDVVIEWNSLHLYNEQRFNCQHFVDDILSALGIPLPLEGSFATYIKNLRKSGKWDMEWKPSKFAKGKFKWLKKSYKFKTHMELDTLFLKIQTEYPFWGDNAGMAQDVRLCKSFDRAFWLRHFFMIKNNKEDPSFAPHEMCPFGDPTSLSMFRMPMDQ